MRTSWILALLLVVAAAVIVATPAQAEPQGIRYRLQVFSGFLGSGNLPVPDGTHVVVTRMQPPPNRAGEAQTLAGPCADVVTKNGYADLQVTTDVCPEGSLVVITLFIDGRTPIVASVDSSLLWQLAPDGDTATHTLIVWPTPPSTADTRTQALTVVTQGLATDEAALAATPVAAAPLFKINAASGIPWPIFIIAIVGFVLVMAAGIWWGRRRRFFA